MLAPNSFDYAAIRVVPRVERGEFINVGVILFCRTKRYLEARLAIDERRLATFAPELDQEEVCRHLGVIPGICRGDPAAGPIALLEQAGRWHWLVAPRSTIIQTSPVHSGLSHDLAATLDRLLETMVL